MRLVGSDMIKRTPQPRASTRRPLVIVDKPVHYGSGRVHSRPAAHPRPRRTGRDATHGFRDLRPEREAVPWPPAVRTSPRSTRVPPQPAIPRGSTRSSSGLDECLALDVSETLLSAREAWRPAGALVSPGTVHGHSSVGIMSVRNPGSVCVQAIDTNVHSSAQRARIGIWSATHCRAIPPHRCSARREIGHNRDGRQAPLGPGRCHVRRGVQGSGGLPAVSPANVTAPSTRARRSTRRHLHRDSRSARHYAGLR